MWGFYLNHGAEWFLENIYHDGFTSVNEDGSVLTWHTAEKTSYQLVGFWKTNDGSTSSIQTFFIREGEIVRIEYYSYATRKTYLIYTLSRKDDLTIAVKRTCDDGQEVYFEIQAQKNEQGRVVLFRCTDAEEGFEAVALEYDEKGRIIRHRLSGAGAEDVIYEYTFDESGRVLSQKIADD